MRFQIVRTEGGYHARITGDNHEIVWATETYTREQGAQEAIELIGHAMGFTPIWEDGGIEMLSSLGMGTSLSVDVDHVDISITGASR